MIGQVVNGYKILRKLGEGGMATVYYAENSLGNRVAVKVLDEKFSKDPDIQKRFMQEADIMMKLKDLNGVCHVIDRTEFNSQLVILMEYLEGMTLKEYVEKKGAIKDYDKFRQISQQVLTTLGEAHQREIIHRDIKPSNLFLKSNGDVKILDFGISKMIFGSDGNSTEKETTTNQKLGTLAYMSPEQIKCTATVDSRTDIYSLGITLYNLITAQDPLTMEEDSFGSVADASLVKAIKHAVRKDVDKRTPSCQAFLNEIMEESESDPNPEPTPVPISKPVVKPKPDPRTVIDKYPHIDFIPVSQFKVTDFRSVSVFLFILIPIFLPFFFITAIFITPFKFINFRSNAEYIENPHIGKRDYHRIVKKGKFGIFRWEGWKIWPKKGLGRVLLPKVVIKPRYDYISQFDGVRFTATKDGETYYLDEKGKILN